MIGALVASVARGSEIIVGFGEARAVSGLDRLAQIREGLRRHRRDHVLKRNVMFGGMSVTEAIEGPFQVAEFVGGEWPVLFLRGEPMPDMPGLDRCDHEIADAWKIACLFGRRRGLRVRGSGRREDRQSGEKYRQRDKQAGCDRSVPWISSHVAVPTVFALAYSRPIVTAAAPAPAGRAFPPCPPRSPDSAVANGLRRARSSGSSRRG